jgi:hypothetical protein
MGIKRRSVFTAGSIARRKLGSPGAVTEATFSRKAVSGPETLNVESDDERAVGKETRTAGHRN